MKRSRFFEEAESVTVELLERAADVGIFKLPSK
jgi:hypothetical protein